MQQHEVGLVVLRRDVYPPQFQLRKPEKAGQANVCYQTDACQLSLQTASHETAGVALRIAARAVSINTGVIRINVNGSIVVSNHLFCKATLRISLLLASLAAGFGGIYYANAASDDAAAPQAHSDGLGAVITDTAITAKVRSKLMGEEGLKKSDISVTTTNGVVTLEGTVSDSDAKVLAETLTKAADGVKSVDNNLKVPANSATEAKTRDAMAATERAVSDSWITTKVKSEILADSVSKGFNVSVETIHGVVVLKGTLATQDGIDHIKAIAAKVKGVKSVDTSALTVAAH